MYKKQESFAVFVLTIKKHLYERVSIVLSKNVAHFWNFIRFKILHNMVNNWKKSMLYEVNYCAKKWRRTWTA